MTTIEKNITCEYPECNNMLDTNQALIDKDTGQKLCKIHARKCKNCNSIYCIDNMLELVSNEYGKCKNCYTKCVVCNKLVDIENGYNQAGDIYCETCFYDNYSYCESCHEFIPIENIIYNDQSDKAYCSSCYEDHYSRCDECDKEINKDIEDEYEINNKTYCEQCHMKIIPYELLKYTDNLSNIDYNKKDKYIDYLIKILPISVRDLKLKYPQIASNLADLISFGNSKILTSQIVENYQKTLVKENFPITYSSWHGVQRSVKNVDDFANNHGQLVINITASPQMLSNLKSNKKLYVLFDFINNESKNSGHPYVKDQIGWIRVELAPEESYILVDEIQSDHSNSIHLLKNESSDLRKDLISLFSTYDKSTDNEEINKIISEYSKLFKDFANLASQTAITFAKNNGYKKVYWHTYESNKLFKRNNPPKSLYDNVPKENFFVPSTDKPFNLNSKFFEREANKTYILYKLARKLYFKYIVGRH